MRCSDEFETEVVAFEDADAVFWQDGVDGARGLSKHECAFVELVCRICRSIVAGYDWSRLRKRSCRGFA